MVSVARVGPSEGALFEFRVASDHAACTRRKSTEPGLSTAPTYSRSVALATGTPVGTLPRSNRRNVRRTPPAPVLRTNRVVAAPPTVEAGWFKFTKLSEATLAV